MISRMELRGIEPLLKKTLLTMNFYAVTGYVNLTHHSVPRPTVYREPLWIPLVLNLNSYQRHLGVFRCSKQGNSIRLIALV